MMNHDENKSCYSKYPFPHIRDLPDNFSFPLITAHAVSSVIITTMNIMVTYGLVKTKQFKTMSQKLFIFLSTSDAITGSLVSPLTILAHLDFVPCKLEIIPHFANFLFLSMSVGIVMIIALDRFVKLRWLHNPNKHISSPALSFFIALNFISSVMIASLAIYSAKQGHTFYFLLAILATETSSFVVILRLYTLAIKNVRSQVMQISNSCNTQTRFPRRDVKMAKAAYFILLMFFICYGPNIVLTLIYHHSRYVVHGQPSLVLTVLQLSSFLLCYWSAVFNSLILISRNRPLRVTLIQLICAKCFRRARDMRKASTCSNTLSRKDLDNISFRLQSSYGAKRT